MYNPYCYEYPNYFLGQIHCHSTRSDGKRTPLEQLKFYGSHNFYFVAITDHDIRQVGLHLPHYVPCKEIFDPCNFGTNVLCIPAEESGHHSPHHLLSIGLKKEHGCRHERPSDGTCWKKHPSFDIRKHIEWLKSIGALAIAPHPNLPGDHYWTDEELSINGLIGMEIHNDEYNDGIYKRWDSILAQGRHFWGFLTDDHDDNDGRPHKAILVLSNGEIKRPDTQNILDEIRCGNFFSIQGPLLSIDGYPKVKWVYTTENTVQVAFKLDCEPVKIRFFSATGQILTHDDDKVYYPDTEINTTTIHGASCGFGPGDIYVRFEFQLLNYESRMLSQPIFL